MLRADADHDAPFFQSPAWVQHIALSRRRQGNAAFRQHVATVWRGEDLLCIWPLGLFHENRACLARSIDDPFGQFAGVVFAAEAPTDACVAAVLWDLKAVADAIQLEAVVEGSALHAALTNHGAQSAATSYAVVVDLRPYPTIQAFAQTVNAKTRKNMRNLTNRLRRAHAVEHVVTVDTAAMEPLLTSTFASRTEWLHRYGRTSAAFRDRDFRALVSGLAGSKEIELLGFQLLAGEIPIASQWGFLHDNRYYAYMSAMNEDFAAFSPGRLHLGMVIEFCYEHGIKVIELMPPPADYKLAWSGKTKALHTLALPLTLRGRAALGFANIVMPALRRLSRKLPEGLRRGIVRRLNRN
jgi:CelD/BcsL family acetyltransferase involved in cellulose biosynthesis